MAGRKVKITLLVLIILAAVFFAFRKPLIRATLPEIQDVTLSEIVIENDSAFVKLALIVRNKGIWHIELQQVKLGVYDDDVQLISYESDTLKVIGRNEVKREVLFCKIPLRTVMNRIRDHQGEDTVGLHLRGELYYSTFIGDMSSEVDRKIPVNVPVPPRLFVRGIEYNGRSEGNYNLLFHLTLRNENPRALDMKDLSYELHGTKGIDLHGSLSEVSIAAQDSTRLDVPAVMEVDHHLLLISEILLDKDQMAYSFVLRGTIESLTGIAEEDVPVTVSAVGQMELYNEDKTNRPKVAIRKRKR